ncbi:hypothetical protein H8S37_04030 [Mediterraneibacter sp. NSJ-55]|uniref:Uncharacterized protein n=1 Tax=Mediterraneibacter hominis TaxID=2763054 RepID=A0A923LG51_9FIRM|nr:hypothetical protein [Mediterraneibacter hominis]MBC5688102.1 hypothetical protein [Mediterraneibacter hominis]
MSYSSLWVMDKKFYGEVLAEFKNSWLFSPIIWDVLSDKYLPKKFGYIQSIIGSDGNNVWEQINDLMNHSDNTCERICWEMSNQCVYFTKDKECIADSILEFAKTHKEYLKDKEDNVGALEREHIIERFTEISDTIRSIDENAYPYFIFKNTSVDDGVERWFETYNEETDEYEPSSLKDFSEFATEFVVIENGGIKDFISNIDYDYYVKE